MSAFLSKADMCYGARSGHCNAVYRGGGSHRAAGNGRGGNKLTGHISHRHRPECCNCSLGCVTLLVDLQVDWRDVGKDAAQRVQPTCLTGRKAAHRTSLAAVIETITECATTNN